MTDNTKWVRIALVVGCILLGLAVALTVWDAAADNPTPDVTITGTNQ